MSKKILVIDDDAAVRSAFRLALDDEDYEVILAENGQDGLGRLTKEKVDLIYLDLKMPGTNGVEVLRKIRAENREVPVRIVTAFAAEFMEPLECAASEGLAFELVGKPLERDAIIAITESVLKNN